jgi:shikimate kinase
MKGRNICIVGFMGAGKSIVARLLALLTGWKFVDMDAILEARYGPIPLIFKKHGEAYFRNLESKLLRELLSRGNLVISTGGGAFIFNRRVMLANSTVIWLDVPFGVAAARIKKDKKNKRPLADANMATRYTKRRPLYARAHIRVDANRPVSHVVASVRKAMIRFRTP